MTLISQDQLPDFKPFPGYVGKLVHAETMTIVYWTVQAGCDVPTHSHPHEQVVTMLEGEFELVMDGESMTMRPGDVLVIPGNVPHSGHSITQCKLMDVWHPCREDYQV